jgi:hypothetical protein
MRQKLMMRKLYAKIVIEVDPKPPSLLDVTQALSTGRFF